MTTARLRAVLPFPLFLSGTAGSATRIATILQARQGYFDAVAGVVAVAAVVVNAVEAVEAAAVAGAGVRARS